MLHLLLSAQIKLRRKYAQIKEKICKKNTSALMFQIKPLIKKIDKTIITTGMLAIRTD